MSNPADPAPTEATPVVLWRWPHDQRNFFAPLSDERVPYLHEAAKPPECVEYRALPVAAYDALLGERARLRDYALIDAACPCCEETAVCHEECTYATDCPVEWERCVRARAALGAGGEK